MIISCPECGTRYDVPESAIGPAGRKLKCAACGHRWHIEAAASPEPPAAPPETDAQGAPAAAQPAPPPAPPVTPPLPLPVAPAAPPVQPVAAPPAETETIAAAPSPFDYQPPFAPPRRTRWLLWLVAALIVLAAGAFFAVRANVGGLGARLSLTKAAAGSPLVISFTSTPERRPMDSGNVLLSVAGRLTNPTASPVRVPDIRAELRDAQGRPVYNWTIGAPVTRLAPGASVDFNSAEVDVPQAARTIHLKPGPTPQV